MREGGRVEREKRTSCFDFYLLIRRPKHRVTIGLGDRRREATRLGRIKRRKKEEGTKGKSRPRRGYV